MKRILLGLVGGLLAVAGLSALPAAPASAACPYTNCITTAVYSEARSNVPAGTRVAVRVAVQASGNVDPVGSARLVVIRKGNGKTVFSRSQSLRDRRTRFVLPKLKKGQYRIAISYTPRRESTFKASKGTTRSLKVRPARRR
jgi:hypothetical protein